MEDNYAHFKHVLPKRTLSVNGIKIIFRLKLVSKFSLGNIIIVFIFNIIYRKSVRKYNQKLRMV